ncbi:hypothetical protein EBS43_12620, partial [bacterium]|nr:hypothetical protein [bacterium]
NRGKAQPIGTQETSYESIRRVSCETLGVGILIHGKYKPKLLKPAERDGHPASTPDYLCSRIDEGPNS